MKSARFVCSFAILLLAALVSLLMAQSNPVGQVDRLAALPNAAALTADGSAQLAAPKQKPPVEFAKAASYETLYESSPVAVGDLNEDGKPDLVVVSDSTVSILFGNGDGTFQQPVNIETQGAYDADGVAIADVNGDGHLDLVVANVAQCRECNAGVGVLLGNGDGSFQTAVTYAADGYFVSSVAAADLNGDGKLDLVVGSMCQSINDCNNGYGPGEVSVLLGNGDGTFQSPVCYGSGGYGAVSIAAEDLNADGHPDLVVANFYYPYDIGVLLGNGDGTFQAAETYSSGGEEPDGVVIGDVNGDGRPDLIIANYLLCGECSSGGVGVLLGNGDGTFQAPASYGSFDSALSVAMGDVNGDGNLDLIVGNRCGTNCNGTGISVLLGNGDGTFLSPFNYSSGGQEARAVAVADLNGDGKPDIAVANFCHTRLKDGDACLDNVSSVGVLLNDLTATTTTSVTSSVNPSQLNQSVTFTATITSVSSVPNGSTVIFYDGAILIGTAKTTNGIATVITSFPKAKTYTIKAKYPGDAFHKASSGTVKQTVIP
jgi:hypothetical protein